jgi:hypothetical protein
VDGILRPMSAHGRRRAVADPVELAVMVAFAALSAWVLALDLFQVIAHGWDWTGTAGVFLVDQMQYVTWIGEASRHVLVSDLFTLGHTPADLFEPVIVLSGGLTALGVAPWLALLLWQPVAVGALLWAGRAYVHQAVPGRGSRRAALTLGLFTVGPGALVAERIVHADPATKLQLAALTKDLWLGFWSWGYPLGLLALAAILGAIVAYDRDRARGRVGPWPALLGAVATLVHPWQGVILIAVLTGAEVPGLRERGRVAEVGRRLGPAVAATALPLVYFGVLARADPVWRLSEAAARGSVPLWMVAVTLAPLGLPALLALRRWPATFLARVTRLWPVAALLLFGACEAGLGSVPTHAFLGVTLPLAVLAVEGAGQLRSGARPRARWLVVAGGAVLAALVVAAGVNEADQARQLLAPGPIHGQASGPGDANFVLPDERRALDYLAHDPQPGGVLTRFYLGAVVPGLTGRRTFVGSPYYSPGYLARSTLTDQLFLGGLPPRQARAAAIGTGARFLLADCRTPAPVVAGLRPASDQVKRFGCATVLRLRGPLPAPAPVR